MLARTTSDDDVRERVARVVNRIVVPAFTRPYQPFVKREVDGAIVDVFEGNETRQSLSNMTGNIDATSSAMQRVFRRVEYRLKASGTCPLDEISFAFSMVKKVITGDDPGKLDRLFFQ